MSFLDSKERIMDILLTQEGRKRLSQGNLQIKYYRFFDDEVDYQTPFFINSIQIQSTSSLYDPLLLSPTIWLNSGGLSGSSTSINTWFNSGSILGNITGSGTQRATPAFLNGIPAAGFSNTNQTLMGFGSEMTLTRSMSLTGGYSAYVALNVNSIIGDNGAVYGNETPAAFEDFWGLFFMSTSTGINLHGYHWDGAIAQATASFTSSIKSNTLVSMRWSGSSTPIFARVAGGHENRSRNANAIAPGTDRVFKMGKSSGARHLSGVVGEVLIFNRALTNVEDANIRSYFASKFGLPADPITYPRNIPGNTLWLNPGGMELSGAFIRNWYNSGSAGDVFSDDPASLPGYTTVYGSGGIPFSAAFFNNSTNPNLDRMTSSVLTVTGAIQTNQYHGFMLLNLYTVASNSGNPWTNEAAICDNGASFWGLHFRNNGGAITAQAYHWDGATKKAEASFTTGTLNLIEWRYNGANIFIRINNSAEVTGDAAGAVTNLSGKIRIGGAAAGGTFITGTMVEPILFDRNLSPLDREYIRSYYVNKYGVVG